MHDKLRVIISEILDVPLQELPIDASPDTVFNWDSLKQITILLAVEEEFGIRFGDTDIPRLFGILGFEKILKEQGRFA